MHPCATTGYAFALCKLCTVIVCPCTCICAMLFSLFLGLRSFVCGLLAGWGVFG